MESGVIMAETEERSQKEQQNTQLEAQAKPEAKAEAKHDKQQVEHKEMGELKGEKLDTKEGANREAKHERTEKKARAQSNNTEAEEIAEDVISDEEELLRFIEESEPKIYVVGTGGSGSNTLNRLFEMEVDGITSVAVNTDARHLLHIKANRKVLIGKKLTRGRGCGSNPECGEKAAEEGLEEIKKVIGDANLCFVTCGLGGGTGTGSAPIIAKVSKKEIGALTVAVVTLPFTSEGKVRYDNAMRGLDNLRRNVDTLIVIKNDKLLNLAPDLPLNTAFKISDEVLAGSVKSITELVTRSGLVNVDFADLMTVLENAGYAVIGVGEATVDIPREERARIAVETALQSPLLNADVSGANRALINIVGGEDLSIKEVEYIVSETAKRISPDAHIIFGARIEPAMKKSAIKVLIVLAGVKFGDFEEEGEGSEELSDLQIDMMG